MRRALTRTLLVLLGAGSTIAAEPSHVMEMSLEELASIRVVSASRYEQNLLESPSAISVMSTGRP